MKTKTDLKSYLVMSVFLLGLASTSTGRIIYVDHDVTGNTMTVRTGQMHTTTFRMPYLLP
jgi:hypothetical protein